MAISVSVQLREEFKFHVFCLGLHSRTPLLARMVVQGPRIPSGISAVETTVSSQVEIDQRVFGFRCLSGRFCRAVTLHDKF